MLTAELFEKVFLRTESGDAKPHTTTPLSRLLEDGDNKAMLRYTQQNNRGVAALATYMQSPAKCALLSAYKVSSPKEVCA